MLVVAALRQEVWIYTSSNLRAWTQVSTFGPAGSARAARIVDADHPRIRDFIQQVVGLCFVATPHTGSQLADAALALSGVLRTNPQVAQWLFGEDLRGLLQAAL